MFPSPARLSAQVFPLPPLLLCWVLTGSAPAEEGKLKVLLLIWSKCLGIVNSQCVWQSCTFYLAVIFRSPLQIKLKLLDQCRSAWAPDNLCHSRIVQVLPLPVVPLLDFKSHTYLQHCSCRCCIILLLFCNEKPTSSSSPPLLLHLLANKGLHYLQLHGSHQLQNCRYCNTQNILKRDKRNNYMCKTP